MTPICPGCGSVRVERIDKNGVCRETDCGHNAPWKNFANLEPAHVRPPNTVWRDPVALSMDGY